MAVSRATPGPDARLLLIVDDDADTRMALRNYLLEMFPSMSIEMAAYGAEAMRKMEAAPVDVLLTDENMPGIRGTQLVAWARERHPAVHCLMMSAEEGAGFEAATADLGVQVFRKPFDERVLTALLDAVRQA